MDSILFAANAKINLALSVIGKRNDSYHELDTVMQTVDISDEISIKKSRFFSFESDSFNGENNIAFKAAHCFFGAAGIKPQVQIKIKKFIPSSAGLGGGSTDAAGVLTGLNKIFETGFSKARLCEMAVSLGADVPFLIDGGTQRARGIGEILTPLPAIPKCSAVIILAGDKPSTAEMFARLDKTDYPRPDIEKTVTAVKNGSYSELTQALGNSFSVLWEGSNIPDRLYSCGADAVSLSGSGPARFALFPMMKRQRWQGNILRTKAFSSIRAALPKAHLLLNNAKNHRCNLDIRC